MFAIIGNFLKDYADPSSRVSSGRVNGGIMIGMACMIIFWCMFEYHAHNKHDVFIHTASLVEMILGIAVLGGVSQKAVERFSALKSTMSGGKPDASPSEQKEEDKK